MKTMLIAIALTCGANLAHASNFKWGCSGTTSEGISVNILGGCLFEGGDYYEVGKLELSIDEFRTYAFGEKQVSISGDGHVLNVLANGGGHSVTIRHYENTKRRDVIRVDANGTLLAIDSGTCRFKQLPDQE